MRIIRSKLKNTTYTFYHFTNLRHESEDFSLIMFLMHLLENTPKLKLPLLIVLQATRF